MSCGPQGFSPYQYQTAPQDYYYQEEQPTHITLNVVVPEKAIVIINGKTTSQTGIKRSFYCESTPGKKYTFVIETLGMTRKIVVKAGETATVNFVSSARK